MNSHLQSIIDCIEQIRLEGTENHSLEADDDYTAGFNDALQAVLSKIEELQKEERIQNLEQLIKMAKEDNQDTSYMEGMLKGYKDLLEFSS